MRLRLIVILALTAAVPARAPAAESHQAAVKADIAVNDGELERSSASDADETRDGPKPAAAAKSPIGVNEPGVNRKDPAIGGVGQAGDTYERGASKSASGGTGINEPGINLKKNGD